MSFLALAVLLVFGARISDAKDNNHRQRLQGIKDKVEDKYLRAKNIKMKRAMVDYEKSILHTAYEKGAIWKAEEPGEKPTIVGFRTSDDGSGVTGVNYVEDVENANKYSPWNKAMYEDAQEYSEMLVPIMTQMRNLAIEQREEAQEKTKRALEMKALRAKEGAELAAKGLEHKKQADEMEQFYLTERNKNRTMHKELNLKRMAEARKFNSEAKADPSIKQKIQDEKKEKAKKLGDVYGTYAQYFKEFGEKSGSDSDSGSGSGSGSEVVLAQEGEQDTNDGVGLGAPAIALIGLIGLVSSSRVAMAAQHAQRFGARCGKATTSPFCGREPLLSA